VIFEIRERTDKQTDTRITILLTTTRGEVTMIGRNADVLLVYIRRQFTVRSKADRTSSSCSRLWRLLAQFSEVIC